VLLTGGQQKGQILDQRSAEKKTRRNQSVFETKLFFLGYDRTMRDPLTAVDPLVGNDRHKIL
jgi:hypothetical protein